jgi:hypothetical protein
MSYTRKFESFKKNKNTKSVDEVTPEVKKEDNVSESTMTAGNIIKVVTSIDVPTSLVNAYAKKVKDTYEKDITSFLGKEGIAEELVKYVSMNFLNVDSVHAGALTGDPDPAQAQMQVQPAGAQVQPLDGQVQAQPLDGQVQTQPIQGQVQAQPVQGQVQAQPVQGQVQGQVQAQPVDTELQSQAQAQIPPAQGEFEEVQDEDDEEENKDDLEGLPI